MQARPEFDHYVVGRCVDVQDFVRSTDVMVGSDGNSVAPEGTTGQGRPHPRFYGTFAKVLGHYSRDLGLLPLHSAVYKMTGASAKALGLRPGTVLSLVILPQALRVIIPPLTSQMLNLTKNSSLAVAIGYPDFVSVANTTINQTGQAIEGVAMIMIVYLCLSLLTSAFMNWYNKKMALVER